MNRFITNVLTVFLLAASHLAFAQYATLDNENSSVSFVTTKVQDIQEVMHFDRLAGHISEDGRVEISIDATSVNTQIAIRDDRMKEHLFEVDGFPEIVVQSDVDLANLSGIGQMEMPATLKVLGMEHSIIVNMLVAASEDSIIVTSTQPVLVNADNLGLSDGLAVLGQLAGGIWIGQSVPVSFALTFEIVD